MNGKDDVLTSRGKLAKAAFIEAGKGAFISAAAADVIDDDNVWRAVARAVLAGPEVPAAPPVEFDGGAVLGPRECHLWYSPTAAARHKRMPMYRLRDGTVTPVTMAVGTGVEHCAYWHDEVYLGIGVWDSGSAEYWNEYDFARY